MKTLFHQLATFLAVAAVCEPQSVAVNRFLDPAVVALYDHSAVEALLKGKPGKLN